MPFVEKAEDIFSTAAPVRQQDKTLHTETLKLPKTPHNKKPQLITETPKLSKRHIPKCPNFVTNFGAVCTYNSNTMLLTAFLIFGKHDDL